MNVPGKTAPRRASRTSIRLPAGETGLSMARQFAASVAQAAGWDDHIDDVAMLISELATNAILHGQRPIAITVETSADRVRVEVMDAAPSMPVELDAGPELESGRGLAIVAALAHDWGAERLPGSGKVVWAELRNMARRQ
jgi:anti-sigma regulatory factor (Ser/Thr protein kinase)